MITDQIAEVVALVFSGALLGLCAWHLIEGLTQ